MLSEWITIKDLIEHLSKYPQDTKVGIGHGLYEEVTLNVPETEPVKWDSNGNKIEDIWIVWL